MKVAAVEARVVELNALRQMGQEAKGVKGSTRSVPAARAPSVPTYGDDEGAYGPERPELSKEVSDRARHHCTECGATDEELHVHHILPLSQGGTHDPDNLITLCRRCHANMHPHMSP